MPQLRGFVCAVAYIGDGFRSLWQRKAPEPFGALDHEVIERSAHADDPGAAFRAAEHIANFARRNEI